MGSHTMDDLRREMEKRRLEGKRRLKDGKPVAPAVDSMTIKRLAWAFGCAAKDSELEIELYRALVARITEARKEREGG